VNLRFDLHLVGWLALFNGGFLAVAAGFALLRGEPPLPYLGSIAVACCCGGALLAATRGTDRRIRPRDGLLVVSFGWLTTSLIGALPYVIAGALNPVDAFFESVSGFTTTGSTVIADVTVLPRALLLWRATTHWIGGMGIILFTIAILPLLGIGGMQLFQAEVPGPVADKIQPRLATTARTLWAIYVGLTVAEVAALMACGMGMFDAVCHTFATVATGGFSTRNTSVGEFGLPAAEWVITLFMLLSGMNFLLHYRALTGRWRAALRDSELRYYLAIVGGATAVVAAVTWAPTEAPLTVLRTALFQVVAIITTTGFCTTDFELWAPLAHLVLLALMVAGSMAGSTGGGVKSIRVLLSVRSLRATIHRLIHPHAVRPVKYEGKVVDDAVLSELWSFLTAYLFIALVAAGIIAGFGYDLETAGSAALTTLGNVGPGLGAIGAYDTFAHFPAIPKLVMAACMLLGRLEIFTILALFSREFWRR
jgi:trk system potassium uptake protein TrkH